jgi:hypothetical protein
VSPLGDHTKSLTMEDISLGSIYSEDLSGKIFTDRGGVYKIAGWVAGLFSPPGSEDDFSGVVLALKLGEVTKIDRVLASGKTTSVQAMLLGTAVRGQRFERMPRMSGTMVELGRRLVPFVEMEFAGSPSYAKEKEYFSEDGDEFSPAKYKILEFMDWDVSN